MYLQKKDENELIANNANQNVTDLLSESERAIREGNAQLAYELSVQATQIAPENVDAWLLRATLARSLDERITCVNHLNELAPNNHDRYDVAFFTLKDLLDKNPFLRYLEETDQLYRVINAERLVLSISKKRAPVNPPPPERPQPGPLREAYRWLTVALIGLLVAGIGTVIFAPLAAFAAIRAYQSVGSRAERVNSTVVLIMAFGLFIIGFLFSLGWAVTLACFQGLIQKKGVFLRTPKSRDDSKVLGALRVTQWESLIGLTFLSFGVAAFLARPELKTLWLGFLLAWQGSLFLAAPYFSLLSIRSEPAPTMRQPALDRGRPVTENPAARMAWASALLLAALVWVAFQIPLPSERPSYSRYQPPELPPGALLGLAGTPTVTRPTPVIPSTSPTPTLINTSVVVPTETAATVLPTVTSMPSSTATVPSQPTQSPVPSPLGTSTSTASPTLTPTP